MNARLAQCLVKLCLFAAIGAFAAGVSLWIHPAAVVQPFALVPPCPTAWVLLSCVLATLCAFGFRLWDALALCVHLSAAAGCAHSATRFLGVGAAADVEASKLTHLPSSWTEFSWRGNTASSGLCGRLTICLLLMGLCSCAASPPSPPPSPPPPLQLNGVLLTPDQPDAVDTAYSVDGNGVLVTSSSAVHDAWTGRDGALVLYATKPGEPWAAAVRMQMSANAEDQALLSRSKKQSQDQPAFRADLALRVASCWLSCLLARRGPQPHPMTPHPITTPSPPPLLSGLRAHHVLGP